MCSHKKVRKAGSWERHETAGKAGSRERHETAGKAGSRERHETAGKEGTREPDHWTSHCTSHNTTGIGRHEGSRYTVLNVLVMVLLVFTVHLTGADAQRSRIRCKVKCGKSKISSTKSQ